jgi:GTP-binding protein HflX
MKLRSIDNALFFTKGKLHELIEFCTTHKIEVIVVSAILSPMQERNLTDTLGCKIFDRTSLIIEIFRRAAASAEGKIQVEMALLEHLKSRLSGHGKDMAQQEGYVGARGPGESMKEGLRRYYEEKMRQARKRLTQVANTREVQRKKRLRKGEPLVCLVGYTNAGKSTLLNTLTKSNVLAEDKLFATLDTTTRELFLGENKKALLSDTVGFISDLPPRLIEAFKSTLDELQYATLLLHVIDVSNKAWRAHIEVVNATLKELDVTAPIMHVFNKVDLLNEEARAALDEHIARYEPYIVTHATDKEGVASVLAHLASTV